MNKKPHNPLKADVWALGVCFVEMISGQSPWRGDTIGKLKKDIQAGAYNLSKRVPPEVAEVIAKMIVVDPEGRLTMQQLLALPLFDLLGYPNPPVEIGECLTGVGRRQIVRMGFTLQKDEVVTDEPQTKSEYCVDATDVKGAYPRKSKALAIREWNSRNGMYALTAIPARYPPPS
jgi:serine/threonine protein kinase